MLKIQTIVNSVISSCTYIISGQNSKDKWLIDVGDMHKILQSIDFDVVIRGVFLTHVHYDHIYGLNKLVECFPDVSVYTCHDGISALYSPKENFSKYHPELGNFIFKYPKNLKILNDNDEIKLFDGVYLRALFTPGHDLSCISYSIGKAIFTGDSYIPGLTIVKSFPRSDKILALDNERKLMEMHNAGYKVFPGHKV